MGNPEMGSSSSSEHTGVQHFGFHGVGAVGQCLPHLRLSMATSKDHPLLQGMDPGISRALRTISNISFLLQSLSGKSMFYEPGASTPQHGMGTGAQSTLQAELPGHVWGPWDGPAPS